MKGGVYKNKGTGAPWEVHYPGGIHRRFWSYEDGENFLIALNFKAQEGSLDPRDYRKDVPLGFENLIKKWLDYRSDSGVKDARHAVNHAARAITFFGNANIKTIQEGELEDFFVHLRRTTDLSGKSLHNIKTTLHTFWKWACRRDKKIEMPEFPEVRFELGWRAVVDKQTQAKIIEEVGRISWGINPRIYIGVIWCATYISVRPGEMRHIKEQDIDLDAGLVTITHNKVPSQYKRIYLLPEDVDLVRSMPRGMPHLYFFRHIGGIRGVKTGEQFGPKYLYVWWKRACDNLGVKGVDLYGGTRHSTATALGDDFSYQEVMDDGTGHSTSKAFARYFQIRAEQRRAISAKARPGKVLVRNLNQGGKVKGLKSKG